MEFNDDEILDNRSAYPKNDSDKPHASRVEDDKNLKEEDLERTLFVNGGERKPIAEGKAMGGQNFGEGNNTSAANDKNNPSQYAGNTNAYFDRTEPSDEHPENSNFKIEEQQGAPDYDKAQPTHNEMSDEPKPEKAERGNGENDRPHKGDTGQNNDDDNAPNIPGPNELPDQQKVGEDVDEDELKHIET